MVTAEGGAPRSMSPGGKQALRGWGDWLRGPVTFRFVLVSGLALVAARWLGWLAAWLASGSAAFFDNWDSSWYTGIAEHGYRYPAQAYFPLHPLLVHLVRRVVAAPTPLIGALLATIAYAGALCLFARLTDRGCRSALVPATRLGWLFFLIGPASYIFCTHHTESLFLLLLLAAMVLLLDRRWFLAGLAAGLAGMTKNNGGVLAVSAALYIAAGAGGAFADAGWRGRVNALATFAVPAALLGLAYPAYLWLCHGDPLLFAHAQTHWRPSHSPASYLKTFVLANPWQNMRPGTLLHHAYYFFLWFGVAAVFRRFLPAGLFVGLSLLLMPMQGELISVFRYSSFLFPVLFALGDRLSRGNLTAAAALMFCATLTCVVQFAYVINRWAY